MQPGPIRPEYTNHDARPPSITPLTRYLEEHPEISLYQLAYMVGCSYATIRKLTDGKCLPGLVTAFKIQHVTGVPASSWLATELGRAQWEKHTYDWEGWRERQRAAWNKWNETKGRKAKRRAAQAGE